MHFRGIYLSYLCPNNFAAVHCFGALVKVFIHHYHYDKYFLYQEVQCNHTRCKNRFICFACPLEYMLEYNNRAD